MPNISKPPTRDAHSEIQGRVEVIASQIEEADRMVSYYKDLADSQASASQALRELHASYIGLLEDAGAI